MYKGTKLDTKPGEDLRNQNLFIVWNGSEGCNEIDLATKFLLKNKT